MMNASPGAFNGATNYKDQSIYILLRNLLRIDSRLDLGVYKGLALMISGCYKRDMMVDKKSYRI